MYFLWRYIIFIYKMLVIIFHPMPLSNLLLRLLGIQSLIIDFRQATVICCTQSLSLPVQPSPSSTSATSSSLSFSPTSLITPDGKVIKREQQKLKYWKLLSLIICISFAISYPISIMKLLQNPTPNKNTSSSVNYCITYLYYSIKYIVTVIIHANQFICEKKRISVQFESCALLKKISLINNYLKIMKSNQPQKMDSTEINEYCKTRLYHSLSSLVSMPSISALSLSSSSLAAMPTSISPPPPLPPTLPPIVSYFNMLKTALLLLGFGCTNHLKLLHIYHTPAKMNFIDLIWYFYPNIFIHLYVTQFYVCVIQQTIIFNQLNMAFKQIVKSINDSLTMYHHHRHPTGKTMNDVGKIEIKLPSSFMCHHVEHLIGLHDSLRCINRNIEQMNSLQMVSIIVHAFANLIAEVSLCFSVFLTFLKENRPHRGHTSK